MADSVRVQALEASGKKNFDAEKQVRVVALEGVTEEVLVVGVDEVVRR